jgi:hypothetical protein
MKGSQNAPPTEQMKDPEFRAFFNRVLGMNFRIKERLLTNVNRLV